MFFTVSWVILIFLFLILMMVMAVMAWLCMGARVSRASAVSAMTIYGIMITGKTPARVTMARHAVAQFLAQTHPHKQLIIVNHGSESVLRGIPGIQGIPGIPDTLYEMQVRKESHGLTLGDLRNMALNLVPQRPGVAWITWDDDDWRSPDYLELLHTTMQAHSADVVGITRRHECDVSSASATSNSLEWVTELKTGFVHCLVRNDPRIRYQSKDSMEDTHLYDLFRALKKKGVVISPAELPLNRVYYIRTVHGTNTSLYVQPHKKTLVSNPETATWRELSLDAWPDVRLRIRKICQSIVNPVNP